jgi:hypothetical protein
VAAHEHVNKQQFMYHESHLNDRESIRREGLRPATPYAASDLPAGVYMSPHHVSEYSSSMNPASHFGYDRWRVNVTGLDLQTDVSQPTHTKFSPEHIPPERIKLVKKGHPNWKKHI